MYHSVLGRCHSLGANHPIVAACEGLCEALAEGAAYGALRKQWAVYSLCAEVDEVVLQVYLQRKNSIGSGTRAAGFGGKSGDFGRPKKVLDKGRWSLATTSRPQSPAVRGFPGFWYRRRFSRFRLFRAVVELQGATVPSSSSVFHRRSEAGAFLGVNLASLYQRKEPGKRAAQGVLNFLITRRLCPGYSLQDRVLCVAE